jgi:hypothetical protein
MSLELSTIQPSVTSIESYTPLIDTICYLLSPFKNMDTSPIVVSFSVYEIASKVLLFSFSLFLPLLIAEQGDEAYGEGQGKWSCVL